LFFVIDTLKPCCFAEEVRENAPGWSPYASPLTSNDEMSRLARSEFGSEESFSGMTAGMAERVEFQQEMRETGLPGAKKGLIQRYHFGGSWIPAGGDEGLGMTEGNAGITLGLPGPRCGQYGPSYFMLTPNFSCTFAKWKGNGVFPGTLFHAGMSVTWLKPVNARWSFMASVMPSFSSDGKETRDSVRCPVMAGLNWVPNARWKVVFGIAYLNRSDIVVLPYGGLIYAPDDDWRFELMAPQAKVARRLTAMSNPDINRWVYTGGGFGGGTWAIESVHDQADLAMYREYSVLLGYEAVRKQSGLVWNGEIAYIFGRKMMFDRGTQHSFHPNDSLALRFKVSY